MGKHLLYILAIAAVIVSFFSCEDEKYMNSPDARLEFSRDTIMFDTIFTTVGSATKRLSVYNPYDENVLISRIRLWGGDFSNFRINVAGQVGAEAYEVEVPARDSISIVVEVNIDPNGQNLPMVVQDSIEFTTNANVQNIGLVAYGQDFKLVKGETIETTNWTAEKPYLVYDYAYVDSLSVLTIEPGTRIYFHKGAGLYVRGTIKANGTFQNPISFLSDRLEEDFKDIPDQWSGILLFSGSHDNEFNYALIKNANIGLQVGNIENEGKATVELANSRIENMAYAGIFALKSQIYAYNDVIANCGFYAVALLVGGQYEFYHSTIANYWDDFSEKSRSTSSVLISNFLPVKQSDGSTVVYNGDLENAVFGNSIIYGNNTNELELGDNEENAFNYLFDHCIVQVPDTFNISNKEHYREVWRGKNFDPLFINPYEGHNYALDTLSPAKDAGTMEYARFSVTDIQNMDRTADNGPDVGAYERIEKKDDD